MEKEMFEKEKYETPVVEVVLFECEDVISTSGGDNTGGEADGSSHLLR